MPRGPLPGLLVLASTTFIGVVTESMPIGLLPQIADDLGVRESTVGLTVSGYALVVALTAAPLTAFTARVSRRRLLAFLLAVYAVCNLATALAPTFAVLACARVVGAFAHGIFWSIVVPYAAGLVGRERIGWATSIALAGGSTAIALGVPLGTALGVAVGWRGTFLVVAAVTTLIAVGTLLTLPDRAGAAVRGEGIGRAIAQPLVRRQLILITLLVIAYFALYTYVAPYVQQRSGVSEGATSVVLFLAGGAGIIGTLLAGRVLDRRPLATFMAGAALLVGGFVLLLGLGTLTAGAVVAFVLIGAGFAPMPIALQQPLLRVPSDIADTAVALFTTAFNVGIFGGGLLGGVVLDTAGLAWLPVIGLPLIVAAIVLRARPEPRLVTA